MIVKYYLQLLFCVSWNVMLAPKMPLDGVGLFIIHTNKNISDANPNL